MDRARFDATFSLEGRVAIVTGGSRGIGRSIAETFALAGARVVVASRKLDACETVAADIRGAGGEAKAIAVHMGELDDLERLVEGTVEAFGRLDVLVNNAANPLAQPFGQLTPEAFQKSIDVNLRGPVFLTQYALPHLEAGGHGSVINVASAGAFLFSPYISLYAGAKAALLAHTRSQAAELALRGVRVNGIAPGTIDTDMVRNNPPEAQEAMKAAALLKRAAEPDEVAPLALYLASDASSFVTGATFGIDGGLVPR